MHLVQRAVLIADAQQPYREALAPILEQHLGFERILNAGTSADFRAELDRSGSAIALLIIDAGSFDLQRGALLERIKARHPHMRIVVTADGDDIQSMYRIFAGGAQAFIPKSLPLIELVRALRRVMEGRVYVPGPYAGASQGSPGRSSAPGEQPILTPRQGEVLALMARGFSNKEIGRSLNISPGTVKVHLNFAFRALGVHNRTAAVARLGRERAMNFDN